MKRRLEPERLDELPADNPAAIASRLDLALINTIMRQPAILARALAGFPQPRMLLDLGGGDARCLLAAARRLPWRGVRAVIADRLPSQFGAESVTVKASKPEPPIPLPVEEVSVEVWREER